MEKLAIAVMPIADVGGWQEFAEEISKGARADAHRETLRRIGVKTEHAFHQQTPMGDLMVLVWEGVDPEELGQGFATMLQNPASDHERYLRDHVIPKLHGVDTAQPPPPPAERITSITV